VHSIQRSAVTVVWTCFSPQGWANVAAARRNSPQPAANAAQTGQMAAASFLNSTRQVQDRVRTYYPAVADDLVQEAEQLTQSLREELVGTQHGCVTWVLPSKTLLAFMRAAGAQVMLPMHARAHRCRAPLAMTHAINPCSPARHVLHAQRATAMKVCPHAVLTAAVLRHRSGPCPRHQRGRARESAAGTCLVLQCHAAGALIPLSLPSPVAANLPSLPAGRCERAAACHLAHAAQQGGAWEMPKNFAAGATCTGLALEHAEATPVPQPPRCAT
jgi:hypothetical protein